MKFNGENTKITNKKEHNLKKNHKKPHSKAIRNIWEGMERMGKATLVNGKWKTFTENLEIELSKK